MFLSGDPGAPEAVAVNWFASWVALVASRPVKDATAAAPCSLSEAGAGPRGRQFRKVGGGPTPRFEDIRILWDVMAHEPVETACWYTNRNYIRSPPYRHAPSLRPNPAPEGSKPGPAVSASSLRAQWNGLQPDDPGRTHLSIARFTL